MVRFDEIFASLQYVNFKKWRLGGISYILNKSLNQDIGTQQHLIVYSAPFVQSRIEFTSIWGGRKQETEIKEKEEENTEEYNGEANTNKPAGPYKVVYGNYENYII